MPKPINITDIDRQTVHVLRDFLSVPDHVTDAEIHFLFNKTAIYAQTALAIAADNFKRKTRQALKEFARTVKPESLTKGIESAIKELKNALNHISGKRNENGDS